MEYKRLTKEEIEAIAIGTKINFGNGEVVTVIGWAETDYKVSSPDNHTPHTEKLVLCKGEDGKDHKWMPHVLCGATVETLDVSIQKCEYCGKIRPPAEIKTGRIRVNYAWHTGLYCKDGPCEGYAQMSAEG